MGIEHEGKVYLNPQEAADYTRRKRQSIMNRYKEFGWQTMYFGRTVYFLKDDIAEWLKDPKAFMEKAAS